MVLLLRKKYCDYEVCFFLRNLTVQDKIIRMLPVIHLFIKFSQALCIMLRPDLFDSIPTPPHSLWYERKTVRKVVQNETLALLSNHVTIVLRKIKGSVGWHTPSEVCNEVRAAISLGL